MKVDLRFEPGPGNVALEELGYSGRSVDRVGVFRISLSLDWEGCTGFTEFGSAGKEAGYLVVPGGCPALVFAADAVRAVIASVCGLRVAGLGRAFGFACCSEGFKVSGQGWYRQECVGCCSFYAVLDDGAPDLKPVLEVLGGYGVDEGFDVVIVVSNE